MNLQQLLVFLWQKTAHQGAQEIPLTATCTAGVVMRVCMCKHVSECVHECVRTMLPIASQHDWKKDMVSIFVGGNALAELNLPHLPPPSSLPPCCPVEVATLN